MGALTHSSQIGNFYEISCRLFNSFFFFKSATDVKKTYEVLLSLKLEAAAEVVPNLLKITSKFVVQFERFSNI